MRTLARRVKTLESKSQGGDYQETLDFLTLMHEIKHGPPHTVGVKEELERLARELTAQGIHYSLAKLFKEIGGKYQDREAGNGGTDKETKDIGK